jgi:hypothetical protein
MTVVTSAIAGVAAASALTDRAVSPTEAEGGISAVIQGSASIDVTTPDPDGGPDWAVARFVNDEQRECALVGRTVDGRFGRVDEDGQFILIPIGPSGVCGDPAREVVEAIDVHPLAGSQSARSIFFGISYSHERLSVSAPDGALNQLTPGDRGGFLVVSRGQHDASDWTLRFDVSP